MYYKLDHFSVDLDFDLLDEAKEDEVFEKVIKIVSSYGLFLLAYLLRISVMPRAILRIMSITDSKKSSGFIAIY